jgi:murein DD-endopeptidase MepM/ murein hydrolase activator NlpD
MQPGREHTLEWLGLSAAGKPVPDGRYRVTVSAPGAAEREAGSVELFGHFYPVRGRHGIRGAVGQFHAPRNGGRIHEGFDVTAKCGTPLAAIRAGRVTRRGYDSRLYGHFIEIRGDGEKTSYFFAHMPKPSPYRRGDRVLTGAIVGRIGLTGNAAGTPCHLHLQVKQRGRLVDPYPLLRRWDRNS